VSDSEWYAERASFLLSQIGAHTKRQFLAALTPYGLHPGHHKVLEELDRTDGATQQEIADRLGVHRGGMVGLVDGLEERGLVERRRHPTDRRAHALHLTAAGRKQLVRTRRMAQQIDTELLDPLDPDERDHLRALLRRVADSAGLMPGMHPDLAHAGEEPPSPRTSERTS
jgi:DNA-binding MarR family transcriptional regulator